MLKKLHVHQGGFLQWALQALFPPDRLWAYCPEDGAGYFPVQSIWSVKLALFVYLVSRCLESYLHFQVCLYGPVLKSTVWLNPLQLCTKSNKCWKELYREAAWWPRIILPAWVDNQPSIWRSLEDVCGHVNFCNVALAFLNVVHILHIQELVVFS